MNKLFIFFAALFLASTSYADTPRAPWIFGGGGSARALFDTSNCKFQFAAGTQDPSVSGFNACKGSIFCRTGSLGGTCYLKQDSGSSTNWDLVVTSASGVAGPGSATDTAIAIYDGTTGKLIKNSSVFISTGGDLGIGAPPFAYDTGYYGANADAITVGSPTSPDSQAMIFKGQFHEAWVFIDDVTSFLDIGTKTDGYGIRFFPNDTLSLRLNNDGTSNFSNGVNIDAGNMTVSTGDLTVSAGTIFGGNNIAVLNAGYLVLANAANDGSWNIASPPGLVGQFFLTMPSTAGTAGTAFMNAGGGSMSWSNDFTNGLSSGGDMSLYSLGKKLKVKEGTDGCMGRSVLIAGTVTVSTTCVLTGSELFLTNRIAGGTLGILSVGTVTNATSFVINSTSILDTSTVNWIIIDPSP